MKKILHNKPYLDNQETKAVQRVLKSNWLVMGKEVEILQNNIKNLIKTKYAVATNCGTSAIHLSLIALGVGKNDEVILPTFTFVGILNAIFYTGAKPVLCDVEKDGFNIDPAQVKAKINRKTKAIIVPHTFGIPAKIDQIKKLGVPVIEDCAHSIGGKFQNKASGSFGDVSIFSFYATKMITAGIGGMFATNNRKYFEIVIDLINYDQRKDYKVRYNYQMTDITASIANAQFAKLKFFIKKRKSIAHRYIDVLEKYQKVQYWPKRKDDNLNHYRFVIKFENQKIRDQFKIQLLKNGISSIVLIDSYQLLHRYLKLDKRNFPNAEEFAKTLLSLPLHPSLTATEVGKVARTLDLLCSKL